MLNTTSENIPDKIRALYSEHRYAEAVDLIRNTIDDLAPRGGEWQLIANAATSLSDRYAAAKAAERWLEDEPDNHDVKIYAANKFSVANRTDEALTIISDLCVQFPAMATLWYLHGELQSQLGDIDTGVAYLRKAWELDPAYIAAWQRIARLKTFQSDDKDIPFILSLPETAKPLGKEFELAASFACGDLYDGLGEYDRAFPFYKQANKIAEQLHKEGADKQLSFMKNALDSFDRSLLERFKKEGDMEFEPIFVVGPPRSGTTLVEQIISAHSGVTAGGETSALRLATWPLRDFSQQFVNIFCEYGGGSQWRNMGERYTNFIGELFGGDHRVTNKDCASIASIGLLEILFPKAKIIFCDRNAEDIAWSAYKAYFGGSIPWSYDFESISRYIASFRFSQKEWGDRISMRTLNVSYETLISSPRSEIEKILEFCQLPIEEACFNPHDNERTVSTASITQVREPINDSSVGSWRLYERHLYDLTSNTQRFGLES